MKTVSLSLVGDVMLGRSFNEVYQNDPTYRWLDPEIQTWIQDSDLAIGNLETTLTRTTQKWPNKVFNFRLLPSYFYQASRSLRFDYLSLANNHILDFGIPGLRETMTTLNSSNIGFSGAGIDLFQARRPYLWRSKSGVDLMFLSATTHPHDFAATFDRGGAWLVDEEDPLSRRRVVEYVRDLRRNFNGIIVLSLHWGSNYAPGPTEAMKTFARELISAGINLIHGHSAHHVMEMERIGNGLVFYSLGDFIDDYAIDPRYRNDLAVAVKVSLLSTGKLLTVEAFSTKIQGMFTTLPSPSEEQYVLNLLQGNETPGFYEND